jgi:hypothetical protein
MSLVHRAVMPLRILLAATFGLLVVLQTLSFPGQFAHMAREDAAAEPWRWPLTALAAVGILCVQVVIVCTWRLLTMVRQDRIFTREALPWVDGIIAAIGAAWLLLAGLLVVVGAGADDPGPLVLLTLIVLVAGTAGLLMIVMRALLAQAAELRSDLEAVI